PLRTYFNLPSFPTRRSSDLTWVPSSASVRGYWPTARSWVSIPGGVPKSRRATLLESGLTTKTWPSGATASGLERVGSAPAGAARSEEHTSELQSRSDLVCRL